MSADLLAEFDSFYSPPAQQQTQGTTNAAPSRQANTANDPFAFLSSTVTSPPPAQTSFQSQPWPSLPSQPSASNWGDLTGLSGTGNNTQQNVEEDEDDFGDFEEAPSTTNQGPPRANAMSFDPAPLAPASTSDFVPKTRIVRASTMDLMTNNLVDIGGLSKLEPWQESPSWEKPPVAAAQQQAKAPPKPKNTDPNVLFDADDFDGVAPEEEDDDDFGDFETGEPELSKPAPAPAPTPSPAPAQPLAIIDLMSTDYEEPAPVSSRKQPPSQLLSTLSLNLSPTTPYPQAPKSPSYQERNPFPGMGIVTPVSGEFPKDSKPKSPSPVTAWPTADDKNVPANDDFGDDWGAFEDFPPDAPPAPSTTSIKPTPKPAPKPAAPKPAESSWDWDAVDPAESTTAQTQAQAPSSTLPDSAPPPTNIPPPSILLSIFPSLLTQASTALFKPTASQPASVRTRVLSSPETASFLQAYLLLAMVAARILAGRKLRWHRDKFLSQGMSISAAAAGGKGGMKLASVDKAQSAQEDREAADLVALWRENAGRLRSAVAAVNARRKGTEQQPSLLHMPELGASMAVQTVKMVPTAPKPCVVCGLKREERVKGVDFDVEDSFGEWWVEHWGHRACRNFWLEHEAQLRSR